MELRERPAPARHGWAAPHGSQGERALAKRHYRAAGIERKGGAPVDAFVPLLWNPQLTVGVAYPDASDPVFVANGDGTNREELITPRDGMHIHWPTWSSDGHIYFLRTFTTVVNLDNAEVYRIFPEVGKQLEPVVQTTRRAMYPLFLSNPPGLVYSANPFTAELRLWWRSAAGGAPRQLTTGVGEYSEPRASADGRSIVAALYELRQSLVRIPVGEGTEMAPVTDGFQGDLDPVLTPAGDRIVFSSSRDGNRHIWLSRVDGSRMSNCCDQAGRMV